MEKSKNKRKNIILGVTGGIAAYKSAELVRLLKKEGLNIQVVMTQNAARFIAPLTMAVLSENKVFTSLFSQNEEDDKEIRHISLAHWADLIIIAPATANVVAKVAHGMADDLLTSTILASKSDIIFAPAMNSAMINNPIYQNNVKYLLKMGYHFIDTEKGNLACGDYGDGRMANPEKIVSFIIKRLNNSTSSLKGRKILITASATREPIDKVRFISNYSTGKMGFSLAEAARNRGAMVTLVTGPTNLPDIAGVKTIHVSTAEEMKDQVMAYFDHSDVFISAAAVSDFKPVRQFSGKIKKESQQSINLELEKNVDILKEAGQKKTRQIVIGFAAEVNNLEKNALSKLKSKNLDFIVANNLNRKDSGFGTDTNKVLIVDREGNMVDLPLMSKYEVAEHIFDKIKQYFFENKDKGMNV
jgi:phosphopantothenoylcysteine decarboxylase / phosphopantothenate---cysteine ligase